MTAPGRTRPAETTLDALAERFEVFLVDQFGVLHDGQSAYPGTPAALSGLKAAGKRVVLLSNSGKRSAPNVARMCRLGFSAAGFDAFLSSGEVAYGILGREMIGTTIPEGARCLLLARDDDRSAIEGLPLSHAETGADADVILLAGSRGDEVDMDWYRRLLEPAAARRVPCICTNPDRIMLTPKGHRFAPGAIGDLYRQLGGPVTFVGKPHREIYDAALSALGDPDPATVCCIGDSIEHDIAGGADAGLATALVRSGILADLDAAELDRLYTDHGATPDFVIPAFRLDGGER